MSQSFPPTALWRRHAQTIRDRASSYKIDYVVVIKSYLNPEGHQNPMSGSKVTAILLKGWIWPIGEASAGKGLRSTGLPRLVLPSNARLHNTAYNSSKNTATYANYYTT